MFEGWYAMSPLPYRDSLIESGVGASSVLNDSESASDRNVGGTILPMQQVRRTFQDKALPVRPVHRKLELAIYPGQECSFEPGNFDQDKSAVSPGSGEVFHHHSVFVRASDRSLGVGQGEGGIGRPHNGL